MARKNLELIQGDTLTLGFRITGAEGPIDLTSGDSKLTAHVTDMSGRKVIAKFDILAIDMANGQFRIHLQSDASMALRGKHLWAVRYEKGIRTITLAGGDLTVRVGA